MWKKGDKVIIGGRMAKAFHYGSVIGRHGTYMEQGTVGSSHKVCMGDSEWNYWMIQECDLIPIADNNRAALFLLHKEE